MMDLLDAHVPLHNELSFLNLSEVQTKLFPSSVVFVDLDRDIVHLDNVKEMSGQLHKQLPRTTPALLERDSAKLKWMLDECDGTIHVMSASRGKGMLTSGNKQLLQNALREPYVHMETNTD